MFAIPLVIVSVIVASLIESFLVLPGHLRHAFKGAHAHRRVGIRRKLDAFKLQAERRSQAFDQECLGQPGHAFEQDMPVCQEGNQ